MFKYACFIAQVTSQIINANSNDFKEIVMETNHVVMVEFFAPWCGHCKALEPEYQKAAQKLKGLVKLVAVDCDNSSNKALCGKFDVKGFPTLKIFGAGSKGFPSDYQGERTAKAIVTALSPMVPAKYVKNIGGKSKSSVTFEEFKSLEAKKLAKVILVTDKKSTPILFKALSIEYIDRLIFGEIKSHNQELIESLKVVSYPTIIVLPNDQAELIIYKGSIKQDLLIKFLDGFAVDQPKYSKKSDRKEKVSKDTKPQQLIFNTTIPEITSQDQLNKECVQKSVCVVTFLTHEPDFTESTRALKTILDLALQSKKILFEKKIDISFVWVNAIKHGKKMIIDFGVSDMYPSMLVLSPLRSEYKLLRSAYESAAIESFLLSYNSGLDRSPYTNRVLLDMPIKISDERAEL